MKQLDYLIIGGGPAGLQLAYCLDREGRDYLVLESEDRVGRFFELYPRHRKLVSINKRYTGYDDDDQEGKLRYDWNSLLCDDPQMAFTNYSDEYFADPRDYARYLRDYAARFALRIQYNTRVVRIDQERADGAAYVVTTDSGEQFRCRALIVATGVWKPYLPDIPGIELTENYMDCSIDPEDYANQKVLIIGKGNSAFETANHLCDVTRVTHMCSPSPIKFAWQTHFFGHLRAVNNDFLDTYILKGQNSVLDAEIKKIERDDDELVATIEFCHAEGQRAVMAYDRIIACTGFRWDHSSLFGDGAKPELACECRLPAMTSGWESENLPNLFYAGTIMQIRDLKKTMSNVLHGFRFNVYCLSRMVQERVEPDYQWPCERLPLDPEAVAGKIIQRVSTNAGLMHQPGFLCDVFVVNRDRAEVEYYDILPVDYVPESRFGKKADYYTVTMEYGEFEGDPFAEHREPDAAKAYKDAYLHPRIQRFSHGEKLDEHHISESLENDWRLDNHLGAKPLIRQLEFMGQADATQFQQTHRQELVKYLQRTLVGDAVETRP